MHLHHLVFEFLRLCLKCNLTSAICISGLMLLMGPGNQYGTDKIGGVGKMEDVSPLTEFLSPPRSVVRLICNTDASLIVASLLVEALHTYRETCVLFRLLSCPHVDTPGRPRLPRPGSKWFAILFFLALRFATSSFPSQTG